MRTVAAGVWVGSLGLEKLRSRDDKPWSCSAATGTPASTVLERSIISHMMRQGRIHGTQTFPEGRLA